MTVWGAGFRDLDHGAGLSCKFGAAPLVPATLASDADDGACIPLPLPLPNPYPCPYPVRRHAPVLAPTLSLALTKPYPYP